MVLPGCGGIYALPSGRIVVNQTDLDLNNKRKRHICEFTFKAPPNKRVQLDINYFGAEKRPSPMDNCPRYNANNIYVKNQLYVSQSTIQRICANASME